MFLRDAHALMGDATLEEIKAEFEKHVDTGNFVEVMRKTDAPGRER